ncbi:MtrAB system accessory lipoprotein LpqB [Corynebacterium kozikiae]|uniref:MtrAB system accessory lipoprotein LpqB n=1 Tax=Corynebacterium kozikiae TaxID=2968469 RepID=UPI00211CB409|nr:MtrAB system accessory lipoprotein LpqB [Corynebacterium sp. 76QC2CO]MCQ9343105.1 MtrAB system accessory lipoprotein LpqB [Corynebacterium sp. 76QC2CO]
MRNFRWRSPNPNPNPSPSPGSQLAPRSARADAACEPAPRWRRAASASGLVLVCSLTLGACASLPSNSEPQVLRAFEGSAEQAQVGPIQDRDPDLLLRDFYIASSDPSQSYSNARSFLTPAASETWNPGSEIVVVDRFEINSVNLETERRSYEVRGTIVGSITEGGAYRPRQETFTDRVTLQRIDGQWRLDELGNQIVFERSELRNRYNPRGVYFFDPSGKVLVQDRRWLFTGMSNLDSSLMQLLVAGPSADLAPGVIDELPDTAAYAGNSDGVYQFTGMVGMAEDALRRFLGQAVWTLAMAEVPGPYRFRFDGEDVPGPLGETEFTADSFPEYNPQATPNAVSQVYSLTGGVLYQLSDDAVQRVGGDFTTLNTLESARVAATNNTIAAVQVTGDGAGGERALVVGAIGGDVTEVLRAQRISQPTFEQGGTSAWAVVDGETLVRVSRSAETGEISTNEVDISALGADIGDLSQFQLSPTGVRAAFIMDGRVYTAVVARPNAGERRLTSIQEVAAAIGDTATALDWQMDGSLVVGTANSEAPVWAVAADGATVAPLPSGNIVAPVLSVAAGPSMLYVTDNRAALELPNGGTTASYWREVQGLEGNRSIMLVTR